MKLKEVKHEKCTRKTFSKIGDYIEMPNLIQVQKDSYNWFIEEGLGEVLKDISPIVDYSGNLVLEFLDYHMEEKTKYSIEEAKERDATYSSRLHVKVRLINKETGEIKEQEIFLGEFPLMTDSATFIINGAERVIVSQLVRSPSCYYASDFDKTGKKIYTSTVMPIRGAWLEYETDSNDIFYVRVDRTRKLPVTSLLRSIGIITDDQILELFGNDPKIKEAYLLWYPLIAACSYIRPNKRDPFAAEYIIPQLLMQWARIKMAEPLSKNDKLIGIRYFSCASVKASEMGVNYVFPVSGEYKSAEYPFCPVLMKVFKLTKPYCLNECEDIASCERQLERDTNIRFIDY